MAVERGTVELGVLIYQGAQLAAVHGLTDLFGVANRIAAEHRTVQLPLLRVSHWQVDAHGTPARAFDSHPGPDQPMMALLVPPSIGEFTEDQAPPALLEWIRQQHAGGTVIGGVCIGSIMLARSGLLDGRSATRSSDKPRAVISPTSHDGISDTMRKVMSIWASAVRSHRSIPLFQ